MGLQRRMVSLLIGGVIASFTLTSAHSDVTPVGQVPTAAQSTASDSIDASSISRLFLKSLASIQADKIGQSVQDLSQVAAMAQDLGLTNLPEYSFALLEQAKVYQERNEREKSRFLVKQAVALSPEDGRVYLAAFSFISVIGSLEALHYLVKGLNTFADYPSALGALVLNGALVLLVSCTLAIFVMTVILIAKNRLALAHALARQLPYRYRNSWEPLVLGLILIPPIFFGLLVGIVVWCLVLAAVLPRCRMLGFAAACLTLAWGIGVPLLAVLRENLALPGLRVVEEVNNLSFSPAYSAEISRALERSREEPFLLLSAAKIQSILGNDEEASRYATQLREQVEVNSSLKAAGLVVEAVAQYRSGKLEDARTSLLEAEKDGLRTFELYSNLALVSMALLDTEGYRRFYNEAARSDSERNPWLSKLPMRNTAMLLPRLPAAVLFERVASRKYTVRSLLTATPPIWAKLLKNLSGGESPLAALLLGVFALAAASGLFVRSNRAAKRAQHGATLEGQTASRIWCLVPGGADIVGGRIGGGFAVLASVLALTMISTERPVHLEQVCPIPLLHPYLYLWCAAMLMLLSLAMELVRQRNRSTIERAKKLHEGGV